MSLYSLGMAWRHTTDAARLRRIFSGGALFAVSRPPASVELLSELASVLTRHSVPYAVIGGFALWRWVPEHEPADLDIVVAPGWLTRRALPAALGDILMSSSSDASPAPYVPPGGLLAAGREITLETNAGTLQIVGMSLPTGCDRRGIVRRREWLSLGGRRVAVCSLSDLIAIKRGTGRPSDARHAEALQALGSAGAQQP